MTNIFVTSIDPVIAARNLNDLRLNRMCFEAYEAICAGIANVRYGKVIPDDCDLPYIPRFRQRVHPLCKWVGEDRWHAYWTLLHARALAKEAKRRYGKDEYNVADQKCYEYLRKHIIEIPCGKYGRMRDYDERFIVFYGAFNYDWFRWENSPMRPGHVVLPASVPLTTRYQLSMLHKWLYIDKRVVTFGDVGPPAWALEPRRRQWINRMFGDPIKRNPELEI